MAIRAMIKMDVVNDEFGCCDFVCATGKVRPVANIDSHAETFRAMPSCVADSSAVIELRMCARRVDVEGGRCLGW